MQVRLARGARRSGGSPHSVHGSRISGRVLAALWDLVQRLIIIPPERKIPKHQMLRAAVHITGSLAPAASWVPGAKRWARTARPLSPNPQQDRPPHPPHSWGSSGELPLL